MHVMAFFRINGRVTQAKSHTAIVIIWYAVYVKIMPLLYFGDIGGGDGTELAWAGLGLVGECHTARAAAVAGVFKPAGSGTSAA